MPCPWMYFSLGNILDTPLKDILEKGMEYFKSHSPKCLVSNCMPFITEYITKTYNKDIPVPIEEILESPEKYHKFMSQIQ